MTKGKILVVEDNNIVAKDIQRRLLKLGYTISGSANSGPEAIEKATETQPDLVLMDIKLRGTMDGVEVAAQIRDNLDIPVIYLTAYADAKTLERAKVTEPFGFIVKPFDENALRTNVEIAMYKHAAERKLRESERWLSTTLQCIGDATIATDKAGNIKLMNPMAESLTGYGQGEIQGRHWREVFQSADVKTQRPFEIQIAEEGRLKPMLPPSNEISMIDKYGSELPVEATGTPIVDDTGNTIGTVITFRDVSIQKVTGEALRQHHDLLQAVVEGTSEIIFLKNLEGRFIMINAAGARKLLCPESDIIGKVDYELFEPTAAKKMAQAQDRAISNDKVQTFECVISKRTYFVSIEPLRGTDGNPLGVIGIARDVTELKIEWPPIPGE